MSGLSLRLSGNSAVVTSFPPSELFFVSASSHSFPVTNSLHQPFETQGRPGRLKAFYFKGRGHRSLGIERPLYMVSFPPLLGCFSVRRTGLGKEREHSFGLRG